MSGLSISMNIETLSNDHEFTIFMLNLIINSNIEITEKISLMMRVKSQYDIEMKQNIFPDRKPKSVLYNFHDECTNHVPTNLVKSTEIHPDQNFPGPLPLHRSSNIV